MNVVRRKKEETMEVQVLNMPRKKTRLIVKKGEENVALRVEDIAFIYREGTLVIAVDMELKKYLCARNLMQLEQELDHSMFFRVNRKYIVNINCIKSYRSFEKVKLEINLVFSNTNHQIIVSQETAPLFKKWISEEM
jgi:DNA-binding LytR/AlgR family response regulator